MHVQHTHSALLAIVQLSRRPGPAAGSRAARREGGWRPRSDPNFLLLINQLRLLAIALALQGRSLGGSRCEGEQAPQERIFQVTHSRRDYPTFCVVLKVIATLCRATSASMRMSWTSASGGFCPTSAAGDVEAAAPERFTGLAESAARPWTPLHRQRCAKRLLAGCTAARKQRAGSRRTEHRRQRALTVFLTAVKAVSTTWCCRSALGVRGRCGGSGRYFRCKHGEQVGAHAVAHKTSYNTRVLAHHHLELEVAVLTGSLLVLLQVRLQQALSSWTSPGTAGLQQALLGVTCTQHDNDPMATANLEGRWSFCAGSACV